MGLPHGIAEVEAQRRLTESEIRAKDIVDEICTLILNITDESATLSKVRTSRERLIQLIYPFVEALPPIAPTKLRQGCGPCFQTVDEVEPTPTICGAYSEHGFNGGKGCPQPPGHDGNHGSVPPCGGCFRPRGQLHAYDCPVVGARRENGDL